MPNRDFGRLLNEGLSGVARRQNKTISGLETEINLLVDELGIKLRHHTIAGWRRGYVPKEPELVALLVRYCVVYGYMQQEWAKHMLTQARYTEKESLLEELFPDQKEHTGHNHRPLLSPVPLLKPIYHNLPNPDYRRFVGRQEEFDWLRQKLSPGDSIWQVLITGMGGVGKSALALFTAIYYYEHYQELPPKERFEAIIWISAQEVVLTAEGRREAAPPGLILHTLQDIYTIIAQTLNREDITRAIPEEQDRLVQKALVMQRTLIVIDNLERATNERIQSFLNHLPLSTKCIISSREWMDIAAVQTLQGLPLREAQHMIAEEAATRKVYLNETQQHQLFERTSGLPLPIKLSIARLSSRETFAQVMQWLDDASGDLSSYCIKEQLLAADQRHKGALPLLLTCSLFDRGTGGSREAIGAIADLSASERDEGLTLLQRLSLLNRTHEDRFWLLPLVQHYMTVHLLENPFHPLIERWLLWLQTCIKQYQIDFVEHGVDSENRSEHLQMISIEYLNILGAIRWCYEHKRWSTLLQLVEGIWYYPDLIGSLGELREILQAAIQAAQSIEDERHEGRFLRRLGQLLWEQGQNEQALTECIEKAEEIATRYGDEIELGRLREVRIAIWTSQRRMEEAEQSGRALLDTGIRLNSTELKHLATYRLSRIEFKRQQLESALDLADQSEHWCRDLGWSRRLGWVILGRADILARWGTTNKAEALLRESLNIASNWNERGLIAYNKLVLARLYKDTDRLALALPLAEEASDLFERLGWIKELKQVEELLALMQKQKEHIQ